MVFWILTGLPENIATSLYTFLVRRLGVRLFRALSLHLGTCGTSFLQANTLCLGFCLPKPSVDRTIAVWEPPEWNLKGSGGGNGDDHDHDRDNGNDSKVASKATTINSSSSSKLTTSNLTVGT